MKKQDLYIAAMKAGCYRRKDWVISAFSVVRAAAGVPQPYDIRYNREVTEVYLPGDAPDDRVVIGESLDGMPQVQATPVEDPAAWVPIDDTVPMTPLFYPCDDLKVTPDMIVNLAEAVDSTYGDLLFNYIALVEPFEHRIPYQVGPVSISKIERIIAKKLVDDEEISGVTPKPDEIPVKMYMRFGRCMGAMAGFTQIFVPTLTPKSLQTDPQVRVRRGQLLEEHKDRLHDPVVVSKIQNELIEMDKAWLKDDPSTGFLLSNKTWGTARKRMFLIHGPEAGFNEGGNAELVVNSLEEGWDTDKLVAMFNSTRAGSFYRGALTALGGEAVKFFMRVFQNVAISEEDCGSTLGIERTIEKGQGSYYAGLWEITKTGPVLLDEQRAISLEGSTVLTRSPIFCKTGMTDFCEKCVGEALAAIPHAIGAENTSVASKFMDIMMASAHAKELKTAKLNVLEAFT
ncbi:hypothetical protein D3C76_154710 [compost metagenome]